MVIRKKILRIFSVPQTQRQVSAYVVYITYMVLLDEKKPLFLIKKSFMTPSFYSVRILSHVSNNTTSPNIGGTDTWAVPPPLILGGRTPVPPKSPPIIDYRPNVKVRKT